MCHATLNLGLCDTCLNVDLFMIASAFCARVQTNPGDICRSIQLHLARPSYVRDRLPEVTCRVCQAASTGARGHRPGDRPIRGTPVDPLIEYFVLARNTDAHVGPAECRYSESVMTNISSGAGARPAEFSGRHAGFVDGPRCHGFLPVGWGKF